MNSKLPNDTDLLVQYSHRSLWLALGLLLALGAYAVVITLYPQGEAGALATRLFGMLPIAIVLGAGALRWSLGRARIDPRGAAMQAVLADELRQHSLNRAYRNGLLAVLLAQAVLYLLIAQLSLAHPLALMASATALIGVATVLGSLLVYDR